MDPYKDLHLQYVNGQWRDGKSEKTIESENPYTQDIYVSFQAASMEDVDEAFESAQFAQMKWQETNVFERASIMRKAAQLLEQRREEVVDILVKDSGSTVIKAQQEMDITVGIMQMAAEFPFQMETTVNQSMIPGKRNYLIRKPLGVVAVIGPFNYPLYLAMRSVAPALATGNAVVLKPGSQTPVSGGTLLAKIFEEAGLPKGLLQVVVPKSSEIGDGFYGHSVPELISFTGSTEIGQQIGEVAGKTVKKTILELGGNNAMVVLDDADIDQAVKGGIFGRFMHSGQICMGTNRIIIDESIFDEYAEKFIEMAKQIKSGNPEEEDTLVGPVIAESEVERLLDEVEKAKSEGAEVLLEGKRDGNVLSPYVLKGSNDITTAQNEMFGPVITLIPAKDEEEALQLANDTKQGLSGAVSSGDEKRAFDFAQKMKTGMVHINDQTTNDEPYIAFGGEKMSGIGRFGREHSLDEFTTWKWISVQEEPRDYPTL